MRPVIRYEVLFWIVFILTTTLFVVDRLTVNINPRDAYTTDSYKTGHDRMQYRGGPWSVFLYEVCARISGRYLMAALNALFFTMMHTFHAWLSSTWAGKVVDFSDETAARRAHKIIGVSLAILSIFHVWSILFPAIFSGYAVRVVVGTRYFPLSEKTPKGFKDVDIKSETTMMQADDVYRLIMITIVLGPVVYLSYKLMASNYRWGIRLHQFVMLMFLIDIVRRHTHPHTWVINLPCFIAWIVDYIIGLKYRHQKVEVNKLAISPNYLLIYWKNKNGARYHDKLNDSIGAVVNMRGTGQGISGGSVVNPERLHPFTTFASRGLRLSSMTSQQWDRAVILRTYNKNVSFTKKMRETQMSNVHVWGPFGGDAIFNVVKSGASVLLVGGGSGSGYLIDTLLYLATMQKKNATVNMRIVFTTRDLELTRFWIDFIDEIFQGTLPEGIHVTISLTSGAHANRTPSELKRETKFPWGGVQFTRCDLTSEVELLVKAQANKKSGHVVCQGSRSLQESARRAAKAHGFRYHPTSSFDNAGPMKSDIAQKEEELDIGLGYHPPTVAKDLRMSKGYFNPIWYTQGYAFKPDCYQGGFTRITV